MPHTVGCRGATISFAVVSTFCLVANGAVADGHECSIKNVGGVADATANAKCLMAKIDALAAENKALRESLDAVPTTLGSISDEDILRIATRLANEHAAELKGNDGSSAELPAGIVAAFDFDLKSEPGCPAGWEYFEPGGGRFIVGAGDHDNKWYPEGSETPVRLRIFETYAQDARAGIQETAEARATGGEATHTLTLEEMPSHNHDSGSLVAGNPKPYLHQSLDSDAKMAGTSRDNGIFGSRHGPKPEASNHVHPITGTTGHAGGTVPLDIMPPYIALYFCKKK